MKHSFIHDLYVVIQGNLERLHVDQVGNPEETLGLYRYNLQAPLNPEAQYVSVGYPPQHKYEVEQFVFRSVNLVVY